MCHSKFTRNVKTFTLILPKRVSFLHLPFPLLLLTSLLVPSTRMNVTIKHQKDSCAHILIQFTSLCCSFLFISVQNIKITVQWMIEVWNVWFADLSASPFLLFSFIFTILIYCWLFLLFHRFLFFVSGWNQKWRSIRVMKTLMVIVNNKKLR